MCVCVCVCENTHWVVSLLTVAYLSHTWSVMLATPSLFDIATVTSIPFIMPQPFEQLLPLIHIVVDNYVEMID